MATVHVYLAAVREILNEIDEQEESDEEADPECLRGWIKTLSKAVLQLAAESLNPPQTRQTSLPELPARVEDLSITIFSKGP